MSHFKLWFHATVLTSLKFDLCKLYTMDELQGLQSLKELTFSRYICKPARWPLATPDTLVLPCCN